MVGEEFITLDNFVLPAPEELIERPPMKAKIVKIEIKKEKSRFEDRMDTNIHIYTLTQDTEEKRPFHMIYRYSTRKNSKFGQFILKVYELTKEAPEIQKPIKLDNLIGTTWTWEFKERMLGNVKSAFWLPIEYHGKEPVTTEELQTVEDWIKQREEAKKLEEHTEIGGTIDQL